ncbi:EF-hand domain pair [Phytophthora cactorum]|nr:EF-hand domain pair [Phytophthora cactorum]
MLNDCKERRQRLEATLLNEKGAKMTREEIEDELQSGENRRRSSRGAEQQRPQPRDQERRPVRGHQGSGQSVLEEGDQRHDLGGRRNLDGVVDWEELRAMFNRNLLDRTELEPANLFNVVQFMTYDKKNCGVITADDTMAILFARYGQSQLEMRMKQLFGDSGELTFVDYLERVGKQRRSNVEARAKA